MHRLFRHAVLHTRMRLLEGVGVDVVDVDAVVEGDGDQLAVGVVETAAVRVTVRVVVVDCVAAAVSLGVTEWVGV